MAQGHPTKWARMELNQPVWLNKTGLSVVIWDKWGRKRRGTLIVSIGGLRWLPYKAKTARRISWEKFEELVGG